MREGFFMCQFAYFYIFNHFLSVSNTYSTSFYCLFFLKMSQKILMSTMGNSSVTKEVPVDISLDEMVRSEMVISEAATSTADVILKVDSSDSNNNNSMWTPKEEEISSSFMRKFQSLIEEKYKLKFGKI